MDDDFIDYDYIYVYGRLSALRRITNRFGR